MIEVPMQIQSESYHPQSSHKEIRDTDRQNLDNLDPGGETKDPITFLSVGDIMLGRYVETLMNVHGQKYPFDNWDDFYQDQDLVIGNLEGPIVENHVQTPDFTIRFSFSSAVADLLSQKSFSHLNLANNHTFDQGKQGFEETQSFLDEVGVGYFGHPRQAQHGQVVIETMNEQKVALIGLNQAVSSYFDLEESQSLVEKIRSDHPEAMIMIQIHWGDEYQLRSNQTQQTIAQTLAKAGADIIIGHHPHVVQEVDVYQDTLIFYSLGNFIFDQYFSQDVQEGLALRGTIAPEMEIELIPITSDLSQPQVMKSPRKDAFFIELAERSDEQLQKCIKEGLVDQRCLKRE